MTHTRTKSQDQVSRFKREKKQTLGQTDGRTDGQTPPIDLPSWITRSLGLNVELSVSDRQKTEWSDGLPR